MSRIYFAVQMPDGRFIGGPLYMSGTTSNPELAKTFSDVDAFDEAARVGGSAVVLARFSENGKLSVVRPVVAEGK
jgi:hypothetical protein